MPRTINYLYPPSPSFFLQWSFTHVQRPSYKSNDPGRRRSKARCRRPPAKRHAPRCKSPWALHATASAALKYEAHASTAENRNCRSLRASNSPRSSGFSSNAQSWTLPGAALQRPHKPPSSAALGASDPKLSLNQRAVSTAVSGWVGCASA